eukprot:6281420-Pyramimonas_sp.AAC.1
MPMLCSRLSPPPLRRYPDLLFERAARREPAARQLPHYRLLLSRRVPRLEALGQLPPLLPVVCQDEELVRLGTSAGGGGAQG